MVAKKREGSGPAMRAAPVRGLLRQDLFPLQMFGEETPHRIRDLPAVGFKREVTGIEQPNLGVRNVAPECLRAGGEETSVVLAPDREQWRAARAQELLIQQILLDIGSVIGKQIELEFV